MSFIKESKDAYKKVLEALEKETSDHEISMARGELETIADRALATSAMLEGTPEDGNPLPAWVQSKITNACDYITTVHDYLKYNPRLNESLDLEEASLTSIHKMKEDGKTSEEIAKQLKLNAGLVKKILGEEVELKEFTDAEIAQLKKEFDPLKGKQISTARANQLSNILNKLDDGSLDKLKSALIPFVSAVAASKITQRKFRGVKITNIKVPGLEGMAEETTFWWHDGKTGYVKAGYDNKELLAWLKKNGYKPEKDIKEEVDKGYNVKYKMKKDDPSISMSWYKDKELAQKFLDDVKKSGGNGIITAKEEAELKPVPSLEDSAKKHNVDIEVLKKQLEKGIEIEKEHTKDEKVAEKIALAHIDERPDYYIQIDKLEKKPVEKVTEVKEPTGDLKDACWTGYVAVGFKMKNGKRVPNCVPKSEAYKGAKKIVEKAYKKLKEKK
jgi:hypothetical protein